MKKLMILTMMFLTFFVLPFATVKGAVVQDSSLTFTQYTWGFKTGANYLNEPLGLGFDFSKTTDNYVTIFETFNAISLGAYSTGGTQVSFNSTIYKQLYLHFQYNLVVDSLNITVYGDRANLSTYETLSSWTFTDISDEMPFLLIGYDLTSNSNNSTLYQDQAVTVRFGSQVRRLGFTNTNYTSISFHNLFKGTTYDPGFKFFQDWTISEFRSDGTRINPSIAFDGVNKMDLYVSNVTSVNSAVFDAVLAVAYDIGYDDGFIVGAIDGRNEVDGLLSIAQLVIGVVVNMVLFMATLEVYNISILSIFTTLILIIGVVWIMKAIRG